MVQKLADYLNAGARRETQTRDALTEGVSFGTVLAIHPDRQTVDIRFRGGSRILREVIPTDVRQPLEVGDKVRIISHGGISFCQFWTLSPIEFSVNVPFVGRVRRGLRRIPNTASGVWTLFEVSPPFSGDEAADYPRVAITDPTAEIPFAPIFVTPITPTLVDSPSSERERLQLVASNREIWVTGSGRLKHSYTYDPQESASIDSISAKTVFAQGVQTFDHDLVESDFWLPNTGEAQLLIVPFAQAGFASLLNPLTQFEMDIVLPAGAGVNVIWYPDNPNGHETMDSKHTSGEFRQVVSTIRSKAERIALGTNRDMLVIARIQAYRATAPTTILRQYDVVVAETIDAPANIITWVQGVDKRTFFQAVREAYPVWQAWKRDNA